MNEQLVLTSSQITQLDKVGQEGLQSVNQKYGTGFPNFHGGRDPLAYHGGDHSVAVADGAERVAEAMGLSLTYRRLAHCAGLWHDEVQLKARGVMERESAERAQGALGRRQLPQWAAEVVGLSIRGTEPAMRGSAPDGQMVKRLKYPDRSAELTAYAVASADLNIYAPLGPLRSHLWYAETLNVPGNKVPSLRDFAKYQRGQVGFAANHRFPHPVAERLFAGNGQRSRAVAYAERILGMAERGELETWGQLLTMGMDYARQQGYRGPDIKMPKDAFKQQ